MDDESTLSLSFLAASLFVVSLFASWYRRDPLVSSTSFCRSLLLLIDLGGSQLADIPTVGFSDPVLSYFSALRFVFNGPHMLKYGYDKVNFCFCFGLFKVPFPAYPDFQSIQGLSKVATFRRWMVLASGPELIEDIRKAPDHVLSLNASAIEVHMFPVTLSFHS